MMDQIADFFSREAGQRRRAWLDGLGADAAEAARYYLGPSGLDQRLGAAGQLAAMFSPGADVMDATSASGDMMAARSPMEAATAGAAMAGALGSMFIPGNAQAAGEALTRFGADEAGAVPLMGGGMSDPTQTGWTFRDVRQPVLSRAENRRYNEAAMAGREEVVPIRRLYATQPRVNADFATTETSSGQLPKVIRKDGEMYVMDGHHRITRVAEEGGQNARVEFFDFDGGPAETPLLSYNPQRAARLRAEMDALMRELGL